MWVFGDPYNTWVDLDRGEPAVAPFVVTAVDIDNAAFYMLSQCQYESCSYALATDYRTVNTILEFCSYGTITIQELKLTPAILTLTERNIGMFPQLRRY